MAKSYQALITPIEIAGERLGTLFIYKQESEYEIDDIILREYGTTVVGLEMLVKTEEVQRKQKGTDCTVCDQYTVFLGTGSYYSYF